MNYVLLSAVLSLGAASPVPDRIIGWCRNTAPLVEGTSRIYSRELTIGNIQFNITYGDYSPRGRSRDDYLMVERKGEMFYDLGPDGILDGGALRGVFFARKSPPHYFAERQEEYSRLVGDITAKLRRKKREGQDTPLRGNTALDGNADDLGDASPVMGIPEGAGTQEEDSGVD